MASPFTLSALFLVLGTGWFATSAIAEPALHRIDPDLAGDWGTGAYVSPDRDTWTTLWARHLESNPDAGPAPVYDFSRYTLVGVSLGYTVRCERIEFTRAAADDGAMVVHYARVPSPAPDQCSKRLESLVGFALIPKGRLPIRFAIDHQE